MHCRGQQAGKVDVEAGVTEVMVVVPMHWYWDSEQEEPQTEPMAQQAGLLAVRGSTMQYVSSGQQKPVPRAPMSPPVGC